MRIIEEDEHILVVAEDGRFAWLVYLVWLGSALPSLSRLAARAAPWPGPRGPARFSSLCFASWTTRIANGGSSTGGWAP